MVKLIVSTITIFMCFMILFGYYLDRFGIPLFSVHLLITFLVIGEIALLKKPHLLRSTIKADKKFTLGFVFLYLLQDFLCIFSQHYRRFSLLVETAICSSILQFLNT